MNRPPLGIAPKHIWLSQRKDALREAIYYRIIENYDLPIKWVEEYNLLFEECKEK